MKNIITLVSALALIAAPVSAKDTKPEIMKAGICADPAPSVSRTTFAGTGSIGVAVAGTAVSIGASPIIAVALVIAGANALYEWWNTTQPAMTNLNR